MIITPPIFFGDLGGNIELTKIGTAIFEDDITNTATFTVALPTGTQAGDLILVVGFRLAEIDGLVSTPTGYTSLQAQPSGDTFAYKISYKIATDSSTTLTVPNSGVTSNGTFVITYRPSSPISSVTLESWNGSYSSNSPGTKTATCAGVAGPLIVLIPSAADGSSYGFTDTPALDDKHGKNLSGWYGRVGYKLYNDTPASNHTGLMGDEGSWNFMGACYVLVR